MEFAWWCESEVSMCDVACRLILWRQAWTICPSFRLGSHDWSQQVFTTPNGLTLSSEIQN